ncbi:hypothetical protein Lbru_0372 [Legionella brunensis]|uniref:Uncharacterized protein n=1 Tax=Legionella brunensis TaxID=29422 RepID=A0A0W0SSR2_9GAMM|nr:hypothetical protein Lbru_0372 [Legionella brunensis]
MPRFLHPPEITKRRRSLSFLLPPSSSTDQLDISGEHSKINSLKELLNILGNLCSGEFTYYQTLNALNDFKKPQLNHFLADLDIIIPEPVAAPSSCPY